MPVRLIKTGRFALALMLAVPVLTGCNLTSGSGAKQPAMTADDYVEAAESNATLFLDSALEVAAHMSKTSVGPAAGSLTTVYNTLAIAPGLSKAVLDRHLYNVEFDAINRQMEGDYSQVTKDTEALAAQQRACLNSSGSGSQACKDFYALAASIKAKRAAAVGGNGDGGHSH